MALIIPIPTEYGVLATYWRVNSITEDYFKRELKISVSGYADGKSVKTEGVKALAGAELTVSPEEYVKDCDQAKAYAILKKTPQFANAGSDEIGVPSDPPPPQVNLDKQIVVDM